MEFLNTALSRKNRKLTQEQVDAIMHLGGEVRTVVFGEADFQPRSPVDFRMNILNYFREVKGIKLVTKIEDGKVKVSLYDPAEIVAVEEEKKDTYIDQEGFERHVADDSYVIDLEAAREVAEAKENALNEISKTFLHEESKIDTHPRETLEKVDECNWGEGKINHA